MECLMSLMNDCLHLQVSNWKCLVFSNKSETNCDFAWLFNCSHFPQNRCNYIYIYYIDQIISFIVPPSTSCAVREKIKYVLCLQYFSLKSTKKHAPFAWPLVCWHSKCKPRKRLKALSSWVIKMLCWSYGKKLLKARPKALFSNYFWPKS